MQNDALAKRGAIGALLTLFHRGIQAPMSANDPCIFCHIDREILLENNLAVGFYDAYPVSPGHALVVPRRHVRTIFDTSQDEYLACWALARQLATELQVTHQAEGFNFGVNCGEIGGQSVWHAHIHLIPRYRGDVDDPLGGVRNVIPRMPSDVPRKA